MAKQVPPRMRTTPSDANQGKPSRLETVKLRRRMLILSSGVLLLGFWLGHMVSSRGTPRCGTSASPSTHAERLEVMALRMCELGYTNHRGIPITHQEAMGALFGLSHLSSPVSYPYTIEWRLMAMSSSGRYRSFLKVQSDTSGYDAHLAAACIREWRHLTQGALPDSLRDAVVDAFRATQSQLAQLHQGESDPLGQYVAAVEDQVDEYSIEVSIRDAGYDSDDPEDAWCRIMLEFTLNDHD